MHGGNPGFSILPKYTSTCRPLKFGRWPAHPPEPQLPPFGVSGENNLKMSKLPKCCLFQLSLQLGFILCVWAAYENFLAGLLMVWGELSFLQHNKNRKTCQCRRLMLFSAKNCLEWCAWDVMFGTRTRISQENKVNWKIMLPHNLIYVFKLLQKPSSL